MKERDYSMIGFQLQTETGLEWVIEYPELEGVTGSGESYEEALKEAEENKRFYLEFLSESQLPIPTPIEHVDTSHLSGRLTFRMSKTVHKRIIERSEEENVSINQLLSEAVVSYLEKEDAKDFFCEAVYDIYNNDYEKTAVSSSGSSKKTSFISEKGTIDEPNTYFHE